MTLIKFDYENLMIWLKFEYNYSGYIGIKIDLCVFDVHGKVKVKKGKVDVWLH